MIDPTALVTTLVNVLGFVVTMLVMYAKLVERFTKIETKVDTMWGVLIKRLDATDAKRDG